MKQRKYTFAALSVAICLSNGAIANDLENTKKSIMVGHSFTVVVPADESLKPAYDDLLALVKPYENTRMSPKELGALASKVENAMRSMGYRGTIIKIEKAQNGKPLALSVSYDSKSTVKSFAINRQEVVKQLQEQMNSQWQQVNTPLTEQLSSASSSLQSLANAEDKREWMISTAQGYVESRANSILNDTVNALAQGANSQISIAYDREGTELQVSGKVLIPIINTPSYTVFNQSGITQGDNDRSLFHTGFGARFYPNAIDYDNVGDYMLGVNSVYDYDLDRYHRRISVGGEAAYNTFSLYSNIYRRLSGWRNSKDFDNGLVEERPADGFDIGAKYAIPAYLPLSLTGSYAQWFGDKVSPWGNTDTKDLMKDPHIWSVGMEWNPVPALSLKLNHEIEEKGDTNTEAMLSFNIPLGNNIKDAFNPDVGGFKNTIKGSRNAFIERDYSMPLEYRAKPGKFLISQCGFDVANNDYCFNVKNGFDEPATGAQVTIKPNDKCVIMSQNGSYVTDVNGNIHASIDSSCVNNTVVDVSTGSTSKDFNITISGDLLSYTVNPQILNITSTETGKLTLNGGDSASNIPVKWYIADGAGKLTNITEQTDENGISSVTFTPDKDALYDYQATIIAEVEGREFPVFVNVTVTDLTMTVPPTIDDTHYEVVVSGGTPGGTLEVDIEGPGKVVIPEGGLKFDENGNATVEVEVLPPGEGNIHISVKDPESEKTGSGDTSLNLIQYDNIAIDYPSYTPINSSKLDKTVGFNEDFEVVVHGLMPGAEIHVLPYDVSGYTVTPKTEKITVDANGNATISYNKITNVIDSFKIEFEYYRNKSELESGNYTQKFSSEDIDLFAYQPKISGPEKITGKDHTFTVTVTGGTPGETVDWLITGDGEFTSKDATFDVNGNADAQITIIAPGTNAIEIIARDKLTGLEDKLQTELDLDAFGAHLIPPSYNKGGVTKENTVDIEEKFELTIEGLRPGSTVTVTGTNVYPSTGATSQFTVNDDGTIKIPYDEITDNTVKDLGIKVEYEVNASGEKGIYETTVNVNNYILNIDAPAAANDGDPYDIDISGGRPNGNYEVSVDHGEIYCDNSKTKLMRSSHLYNFSELGTAKCTVTPEKGYSGQVTVTVTGSGDEETVKTDTNLMTYTPKVEYTPASSIDGVQGQYDYNEAFNLYVSGVLDSSEVSIVVPSGVTVKNSTVIANGGKALIEFEPLIDKTSFNFEVKYYKNKSDQANGILSTLDPISMHMKTYDVKFSSDSQEDIDGALASNIYLEGGKPGEAVVWTVTGDGAITPATSYFDANGRAAASVNGIGSMTNAVTVHASTMGKDIDLSMVFVNYGLRFDYLPTFTDVKGRTFSSTVDTNEEFEISVKDGRPGSEVVWTSTLAEPENPTSIVENDGTSKMKFHPITNLNDEIFTVTVAYERNASTTSTSQVNLNLHQYTMELDVSDGKIDAYSNVAEQVLDEQVIKVMGGKPQHKAIVSLEGSGIIDGAKNQTFTFDEQGEAEIKIQSESDFAEDIKVKIEPIDESFTNSTCKGEIVYSFDSWTESPKFDENSLADPDLSTAKTVDIEEAYTFTVTGVYPNSEVIWETDNESAVLTSTSSIADKNGVATISLKPITDYDLENFTLSATVKTNPRNIETLSADINVKQYNLSIKASKDSIVPEDFSEITISGGKAGSKLDLSLSGDGEFTSKDATFDANGEAKAVVTGTGGVDNDIVINYSGIGKSGNKTIELLELPEFEEFTAGGYQNYGCNGGWVAFQPYNYGPYEVKGWSYVKSVTIHTESTRVDDNFGVQVINGNTVVEKYSNGSCGGDCKYSHCVFDKTYDFNMTSSELKIKAGVHNGSPDECYLTGKWTVTLHYDLPQKN